MVGNDGNGAKGFLTVGNHFPQWETFSHGAKSFSKVGFPACLASQKPCIGVSTKRERQEAALPVWRWPKAASLLDGCLQARQSGNPTRENAFPLWELVCHRGTWFPHVGNHFSPWQIIFPTCSPVLLTPYPNLTDKHRHSNAPKACLLLLLRTPKGFQKDSLGILSAL